MRPKELNLKNILSKDIVLVCGGLNLDIIFHHDEEYLPYTSNPGETNIKLGGVGFNIARQLSKTQKKILFASVYSHDMLGKYVLDTLHDYPVDTRLMQGTGNCSSPIYFSANSPNGEMIAAFAQMKTLNYFSIAGLEKKMKMLNLQPGVLVVDSNLSRNQIRELLDLAKKLLIKKIFCVSASVRKTKNIGESLPRFSHLFLNSLEASELFQCEISRANLRKIESAIRLREIKNCVISLGKLGAIVFEKNTLTFCGFEKFFGNIVDVTGAGDAFSAELIHEVLHERSLLESIAQANRVACSTLEKIGA